MDNFTPAPQYVRELHRIISRLLYLILFLVLVIIAMPLLFLYGDR